MRPAWVYRCFDREGALLYIGCTVRPSTRMADHAATKAWWPDVAEVTMERHSDHKAALDEERRAILAEDPRHNRARWRTIGGMTPLRTVRVPDELWGPAKKNAQSEGVTLTDVIRQALIEYVEDREPE